MVIKGTLSTFSVFNRLQMFVLKFFYEIVRDFELKSYPLETGFDMPYTPFPLQILLVYLPTQIYNIIVDTYF